jgi:chaperonin GroEL
MLANQDPARFQVIAASPSSLGPSGVLEDMAALSGGRVLVEAAGDSLRAITPADLGHARQCWVTKDYVGLLNGVGDPQQLERHIAALQAQFAEADAQETRAAISERLGKLTGGTAVLWVGGATKAEIEARKQAAQRTTSALRGAILHGMVPGGGAALLACRAAVEAEMGDQPDLDARAACRIVSEALAEPLRVIASNAGFDPGSALAAVAQAGSDCGFDVRSGQAADMLAAGILDPAIAVETAAYTAIVSAALALTVDVLVHHLKPDLTLQP